MIILAEILPGVNLPPESIVAIVMSVVGLLTLSYKVLQSIVDRFMARIEAQEKRAAEREKEIREAALGQMSEMRADFSRNIEVVESRHADERQQRETVFAASYGTLSDALLKLNDQNVSIFNKLDTDIGDITASITRPDGMKAMLSTVITQLTDMRKHMDDAELKEIRPALSAIQITLNAIQSKPHIQLPEPDKTNGQDHQDQPAVALGE